MKVIGLTLASGSGSRLHPISTEETPKQFLPLLIEGEMMVNLTNQRMRLHVDDQYTVTLKKYERLAASIKGEVLYEPQRMETGFSVLYSLLQIYEDHGDCIILQSPSDHFIGKQIELERGISAALIAAAEKDQIVILGEEAIEPTTDYGYIIKTDQGCDFIEKPDEFLADMLLMMGARWNTAIYVYKLSFMLDQFYHKKFDEMQAISAAIKEEFDDLAQTYNCFEPFSFEEEILQGSEDLEVIPVRMDWDDIGSIERLKKVRGEDGWEKIKADTGID